MTVLTALQSAALRLVGRRPQTFFDSSGTLELELTDMVNEVARDIAKYQDWQALVRLQTLNGDSTQTEFELPADYDRIIMGGVMRDGSSWLWGFHHYASLDAFLIAEQSGFTGTPGGWVIYGDRLRFSPAPTTTARFAYITKNIVKEESTKTKSEFTADTDEFLLPERLLTLGVVWRWRENKKLDATGDQEAFIKALDEYAGKDGGPVVIRRNAVRGFGNTHLAYPWELGEGANYWPAA